MSVMKRYATLALLALALPILHVRAQTFELPGMGAPIPALNLDPAALEAEGADLIRQIKEGDINIVLTPSTPGPGQAVEAVLTATSIDLNRSTITWTVNGVRIASGLGVRTASFTTGGVGSTLTLSVRIDSPDGVFTRSVSFDLSSVDLLWQGEGYVPPFYKGRTLWGRESRITFTAIPHVPNVNSGNLIYRWSLDGEVVDTASGVGKNSFAIYDSVLGLTRDVQVDVMTSSDTVVASASLSTSAVAPQLLVYENSPLYGYIFNREVSGAFTMKGREITLATFPYFFNTSRRINSNLLYTWTTNSRDSRVGGEVTYRAPEADGRSSVRVSAQGLKGYLQNAEKSFLVQFSNNESR